MRRWLRPLWVVLALLFLLEAWLWDHLEPLVARVVNLIPWGPLKVRLARLIDVLPPWAALFVFVIPFIVLLPLKFLEVYFLATRNWLGAIGVILLVKLLGLGITAFIFDVTRDKLLQMAWFRRMYDWFLWARDWAHAHHRAGASERAASIDLAAEAAARRTILAPADAAAPPRLSPPRGVTRRRRRASVSGGVSVHKKMHRVRRPQAEAVKASPTKPSRPDSQPSATMPVMTSAEASTMPIWNAAEANS